MVVMVAQEDSIAEAGWGEVVDVVMSGNCPRRSTFDLGPYYPTVASREAEQGPSFLSVAATVHKVHNVSTWWSLIFRLAYRIENDLDGTR